MAQKQGVSKTSARNLSAFFVFACKKVTAPLPISMRKKKTKKSRSSLCEDLLGRYGYNRTIVSDAPFELMFVNSGV